MECGVSRQGERAKRKTSDTRARTRLTGERAKVCLPYPVASSVLVLSLLLVLALVVLALSCSFTLLSTSLSSQ